MNLGKFTLRTALILLCLAFCTSNVYALELTVAVYPTQKTRVLAMAEVYEREHPGVKVNVVDAQLDKLLAMLASTQDIDVIAHADNTFPQLQYLGLLADLTKYLDIDSSVKTSDFFPELPRMFTDKNRLYAIPWVWSTVSAMYNKDLFGEAGLVYPTQNWTWVDLLQSTRKITKDTDGNGYNDRWGFGDEFPSAHNLPIWILGAGGQLWNEDRTKTLIDSPESIYGLKFNLDLYDTYNCGPGTNEPDMRVQQTGPYLKYAQLFDLGRLGVLYATRFYITQNVSSALAPLPIGPAGIRPATISAQWMAMSANTKHPDEAWDLLKFLTSTEGFEITLASDKVEPLYKLALMPHIKYTIEHLRKTGDEMEQAWVLSMANATPTLGFHPVGIKLNNMLVNAIKSVRSNNLNLANTIMETARQMNVMVDETRQQKDWTK